jgi:hypothetical protein
MLPRHTRRIRTKEGGEFNATTKMTTMTKAATTMDAQQPNKVKKHIICLLFLNSPRATEAARQHTNPWNIDMIFMD